MLLRSSFRFLFPRCTGWTPDRDCLKEAVSKRILWELGYFTFPLKEDNGSTMTDDHRCKLLGCFDCPGQFHHSRTKAKWGREEDRNLISRKQKLSKAEAECQWELLQQNFNGSCVFWSRSSRHIYFCFSLVASRRSTWWVHTLRTSFDLEPVTVMVWSILPLEYSTP